MIEIAETFVYPNQETLLIKKTWKNSEDTLNLLMNS